MIGLHIWSAVKLSLENKAARPSGYSRYEPVASSYASRTMLMSGGIVFVFIVYHLLHYTAQVEFINRTGRDFASFVEQIGPGESRPDIFRMMVVGFNNVWVSGFYVVGLGLLCLHLSHGASAMFQSLGWRNTAYRPLLDRFASGVATLIFLGYTSIPVAILLGYGKEALK